MWGVGGMNPTPLLALTSPIRPRLQDTESNLTEPKDHEHSGNAAEHGNRRRDPAGEIGLNVADQRINSGSINTRAVFSGEKRSARKSGRAHSEKLFHVKKSLKG